MKKQALVTGSAGFIGFHVAKRLLDAGWSVVGVDAISDYYDVSLKLSREQILTTMPAYTSIRGGVETPNLLKNLFESVQPEVVFHFAAQAGVRNSIENPDPYIESNIIGTYHLLEAARHYAPAHIMLASTSSVYGDNEKIPFCENDRSDFQISLYAATKKSSEILAHSYSHLFDLPITIMRFFTVYGPWGRPDMALFKFTESIINGTPIDLYNYGDMKRDFTYVDDLVEAMMLLLNLIPASTAENIDRTYYNLSPVAPYRIVNLGNSKPISLLDFVFELERVIGKAAQKNMLPMQKADVSVTWSDAKLLNRLIGTRSETTLSAGLEAFVNWYRSYYDVN